VRRPLGTSRIMAGGMEEDHVVETLIEDLKDLNPKDKR
jgi:hypothetical protein